MMKFSKHDRVRNTDHPKWTGTIYQIDEWDVGSPIGYWVQWDRGSGPYEEHEMNCCIYLPEELELLHEKGD